MDEQGDGQVISEEFEDRPILRWLWELYGYDRVTILPTGGIFVDKHDLITEGP